MLQSLVRLMNSIARNKQIFPIGVDGPVGPQRVIFTRSRNNLKCIYIFAVMVPVSSTVIPLPVYKVGYGLGFISKDKKAQSSFKPEGGIKLITSECTIIITAIIIIVIRVQGLRNLVFAMNFSAAYVTFSFAPALAKSRYEEEEEEVREAAAKRAN